MLGMSTEDLIASVIPWLHSINQSIGKISAAFGLASEAGAGGAVHHVVGLASEAGGAVNHVVGEVVKVAAVAALCVGACFILVHIFRFCILGGPDADKPSVIARHILLKEKEKAIALKQMLLRGAPDKLLERFGKLAGENSECWSFAQGGALGRFNRGKMAPEIDEVVFNAPIMEVQGPVETKDGFHLLVVLERSVPRTQAADETKKQR